MIRGIERIIQYTFQDKDIIWEALQAPGSGYRMSGNRHIDSKGNKRMALLGDAYARVVVLEEWFGRTTSRPMRPLRLGEFRRKSYDKNGKLRLWWWIVTATHWHDTYMCNENLAKNCDEKNICQIINLNTTHEIGKRTKADTMEAIFVDVVQDGGMESLKRVLSLLGLIPAPGEV